MAANFLKLDFNKKKLLGLIANLSVLAKIHDFELSVGCINLKPSLVFEVITKKFSAFGSARSLLAILIYKACACLCKTSVLRKEIENTVDMGLEL